MVVEIPTAQKLDTNSVGSTIAPWEAVSSDSSSNSSEDASLREAVGTPRQTQRAVSQASEPSAATLGDITPSRRQRWSDLSDSPEKAAGHESVRCPWPEDDGCTVISRARPAALVETESAAVHDLPTGDLQEDDEPEVADLAQSGGQASSGKRRSRRRRRHAKSGSAGAVSPTSSVLLQGSLPMYSPSRASVNPGIDDSMISWPHTPSKFAGLSTQLTGSPFIASGGRSVVTWNDLLGADRTLCPQSHNMARSLNAMSPLAAPVQPATPEHLHSMPLVTAPGPVQSTMCPSPVHAQKPLCEAGARTPWAIPSVPGSWAYQSWPDASLAACSAPTGPSVAPPTAPPTGVPMASHVPGGYQCPSDMQGDALMHWLRANGLEHNSTSDLAEQLRAMAPEAYED